MQVELLLNFENIPDDLLEYFEPVDFSAQRDVWDIATEPEKAAHFATFPQELVKKCILAGTSEKGCCPECGAPWVRVVEKEYGKDKSSTNHIAGGDKTIGQGWEGTQRRAEVISKTIGWKPSCSCKSNNPIPCTVLDPFSGSGKTLIVAKKYGRKTIGIDLKQEYLEMPLRKVAQEVLF